MALAGLERLVSGLCKLLDRHQRPTQGLRQAADQLGDLVALQSGNQPAQALGFKLVEQMQRASEGDAVVRLAGLEAIAEREILAPDPQVSGKGMALGQFGVIT